MEPQNSQQPTQTPAPQTPKGGSGMGWAVGIIVLIIVVIIWLLVK